MLLRILLVLLAIEKQQQNKTATEKRTSYKKIKVPLNWFYWTFDLYLIIKYSILYVTVQNFPQNVKVLPGFCNYPCLWASATIPLNLFLNVVFFFFPLSCLHFLHFPFSLIVAYVLFLHVSWKHVLQLRKTILPLPAMHLLL